MKTNSKETFEITDKVKYIGPQQIAGEHDISQNVGTILEKIPSSVFRYTYKVTFTLINDDSVVLEIPECYLEHV